MESGFAFLLCAHPLLHLLLLRDSGLLSRPDLLGLLDEPPPAALRSAGVDADCTWVGLQMEQRIAHAAHGSLV